MIVASIYGISALYQTVSKMTWIISLNLHGHSINEEIETQAPLLSLLPQSISFVFNNLFE